MLIFLIAFLAAPQHGEEITVTATRTESRVADTPSSVVVLSEDVISTTAAVSIDDVLRQVPGFTLFRRTGSRVANPTSQGVSIRGIGASGASRALVLDDGVPLNDPFGGWIYWGRVPRVAIQRVEVLRGGGSELYGSAAMGGVVQFVRARDASTVRAEASGGSMSTGTASLFGAMSRDEWRGSVALDLFDTSGYTLVNPDQRGVVDVPADSDHRAIDLSIGRGSTFVRLSHYDEERNNGTPMQVNDTTIRQIAAGSGAGALRARAWFSDQDYRQTFSAVAATRATERLTVDQQVPSRGAGANVQWSRVVASSNAVLTGVEFRNVTGASEEQQFAVNGSITNTRVDGSQHTLSAFVEDVASITPEFSLTAGVRYDAWHNSPSRDESAFSPRIAALYRRGSFSYTASAYRAFRAPTLNELYRNFRVGNILTLANESLAAETLDGYEAGVRTGNIRATLFWMALHDVVGNVTLSSTPALITRQRQNVNEARSRGLELEGEWRVRNRLRFSAGYLLTDSVVTSGSLEGKRLPQVPRHQATAQLLWSSPLTIGVQTRWSATQFDDDLNELSLRSFFVADIFASHPLVHNLDLTVAAENVFDRQIEASATPVITLGQPRAWRLGLRWSPARP